MVHMYGLSHLLSSKVQEICIYETSVFFFQIWLTYTVSLVVTCVQRLLEGK